MWETQAHQHYFYCLQVSPADLRSVLTVPYLIKHQDLGTAKGRERYERERGGGRKKVFVKGQ